MADTSALQWPPCIGSLHLYLIDKLNYFVNSCALLAADVSHLFLLHFSLSYIDPVNYLPLRPRMPIYQVQSPSSIDSVIGGVKIVRVVDY